MKQSEDEVRTEPVTEEVSALPSRYPDGTKRVPDDESIVETWPTIARALADEYEASGQVKRPPIRLLRAGAFTMEALRSETESVLSEAVRSEDLEYALQRIGRLNNAVHVLYRVFEAAVVLADAWPGSSPNWDALREAIEAYREFVAPLKESAGAEPEESERAP